MLNNKGFMSIHAILWIVVLFPLLMFVTIDLNYFIHEDFRLKAITDNACSSAITMLNEEKIKEGILEVNQQEAEEIVKKILKKDLVLNEDMSPTIYSNLNETPNINVQVYNNVPPSGMEVNTPAGKVTLKKTSVIVYAEYPVKGLFFKNLTVTIKKLSVSQVQFR